MLRSPILRLISYFGTDFHWGWFLWLLRIFVPEKSESCVGDQKMAKDVHVRSVLGVWVMLSYTEYTCEVRRMNFSEVFYCF
jgi:hypothetical protein